MKQFGSLELPYALSPERFKNPVALPPDFRYQNREYITENFCGFGVSQRSHQNLTLGRCGTAIERRASCWYVRMLNPSCSAKIDVGIRFEDKVGLGEPTEDPYVICEKNCWPELSCS